MSAMKNHATVISIGEYPALYAVRSANDVEIDSCKKSDPMTSNQMCMGVLYLL
jgi:hypothetical protein